MRNAIWRIMPVMASLGLMAGATWEAKADLVINGGFETGNFSGWTLAGSDGNNFVSNNSFGTGQFGIGVSHSGNFFAALGQVAGTATLSQSIATTAGDTYAVSFFLRNNFGTPNTFSAAFAGTTGFSMNNFQGSTGGPYVSETFNVVATSSSSLLRFTFANIPNFLNLDDVSVNAVAVPEPSTLVSAGMAGLIGLGYTLRRRRAKAAA